VTRGSTHRLQTPGNGPRDAQTIAHVAAGDLGELGNLYDRYAADILRFVTRVAGATLAEDVVQTVFVRVVRLARGYDPKAPSARPWLFGIAVCILREQRRSLRRWASALFELGQHRRDSSTPASEGQGDLERAVARLSEAKRTVLLLVEVEGFSCPEVASILGLPVGTVWTRLHHARKEVRSFFQELQP